MSAASYATLKRRLPRYATAEFRAGLASACAARAVLGPTALVLYDVSTLLCRRRHKRCTSRPTPGMGSASPGSARSDAWTRK